MYIVHDCMIVYTYICVLYIVHIQYIYDIYTYIFVYIYIMYIYIHRYLDVNICSLHTEPCMKKPVWNLPSRIRGGPRITSGQYFRIL